MAGWGAKGTAVGTDFDLKVYLQFSWLSPFCERKLKGINLVFKGSIFHNMTDCQPACHHSMLIGPCAEGLFYEVQGSSVQLCDCMLQLVAEVKHAFAATASFPLPLLSPFVLHNSATEEDFAG